MSRAKRIHAVILLLSWVVSAVLGLESAGSETSSVSSISIQPAEIVLHGSRARQRVLVTGQHGSSLESDLTARATYEILDPAVAAVSPDGLVSPLGPGQTTLMVRCGGQEQRAEVRVERFGPAPPIDFQTEVVAVLGRGGCNQGACHGSPQGKGGFRLSLRGFDPDFDFLSLTRESLADVPTSSPLQRASSSRKPSPSSRIKADGDFSKTTRPWNYFEPGLPRGVDPRPRPIR